ncbi:MAG: hypothetical protein FGM54_09895, partial [Chitinophagaceae bacterium]|nr:hypothetical protein [Chitinophagaceae bacterium]
PAGTYKVVVTSPNQCKDSVENIVITQPAAITWNSVTPTNILCFGNNTGSIAVNATGGNGGINYSITPLGPQFGPSGNFTNLTAQQYTVTASDANSCSTNTTVLLTQPNVLAFSSVVSNAVSCNGLSDGSIVVTSTGGNGGVTYTINPNGPASNTSGTFMGLPTNTYTITATDGNGCIKTTSVVVTQPGPIVFTTANFVSPLCFGDANGTIAVATSGGVSPKTYTISPLGPQSNTTGNFTGLTAQQYTVTVTDNNTCTNQTTINVVQPSQVTFLSLGFTQPSCGGNSNGTITASASGGTGPKTYSLLPAVQPSNTTGSFTGITAQTYTVTATDVNGSTTTSSVIVTEPTPLIFTSGNFTQPLCFNGTNGTISVTTSGGTGPKTYTITPLGPQSNTTGNFSNIAFGSYTITAVDINGCSNTTVVSVTQPTQLNIASASFVQPSCNGGNNGTATVSASGGTAGYTYTITPLGPQSNTTGNFAGLSAQCYTITATDVNGCTKTTTVCVTQPTVVVASVTGTTSPTCIPGCDGTITVNGAGGSPTYTAAISPSLTQSPALTFTGACATTNYVITVSDANGCTGTTSTTLAVPSSPTPAAATVTNASCNGSCNGTAQVTIVAGITY